MRLGRCENYCNCQQVARGLMLDGTFNTVNIIVMSLSYWGARVAANKYSDK